MSRKRRKQRQPHMPPKRQIVPPAKIRIWSMPTVLGLILGVVGAMGIIELRPQVTVLPQEPIEKSQPFSVPFRIENSGYLSFYVDNVFCYASKIKVGSVNVERSTVHWRDWNNFELGRGESKTIVPNLVYAPNFPSTADIAIVMDVRPFYRFPWSFRRYFRFTGAYVDNWQWLAQPVGPIKNGADEAIEDHMRKIPSSR